MIAPLIVDYLVTHDMDDGQPLPPFIDDDGAVWRVVRRLPGSSTNAARTRWRRVRLSEQQTNDAQKTEHATDRRQVAWHPHHTAAVTTKKRKKS